jgi:hypothetical protein
MQRDSNLLVEWSKSAEDEVGLLHNADDRSGLGLLCVRGPMPLGHFLGVLPARGGADPSATLAADNPRHRDREKIAL